jgi:hypothetical protein
MGKTPGGLHRARRPEGAHGRQGGRCIRKPLVELYEGCMVVLKISLSQSAALGRRTSLSCNNGGHWGPPYGSSCHDRDPRELRSGPKEYLVL